MMLFISFLYLYKQHLEFRLPSGPKAGSGPVPVLGRPVPIRFRYGKKIPVRFRYSGYRVPWSTTSQNCDENDVYNVAFKEKMVPSDSMEDSVQKTGRCSWI